jgi:hypothetical protein
MKRISQSMQRAIWWRAGGACEYCRFPERYSELRFVLDHIVARQHEGKATLENLVLCCPFCNRHKGPNLSGVDPESGAVTSLFHPRRDRWLVHFRWSGAKILARTAKGRVTVIVLALNHSDQVEMREALLREGKLKAH